MSTFHLTQQEVNLIMDFGFPADDNRTIKMIAELRQHPELKDSDYLVAALRLMEKEKC